MTTIWAGSSAAERPPYTGKIFRARSRVWLAISLLFVLALIGCEDRECNVYYHPVSSWLPACAQHRALVDCERDLDRLCPGWRKR